MTNSSDWEDEIWDDEEWDLTPEDADFYRNNAQTIRDMYGVDTLISGIKAKFRTWAWLLIDHGSGVEVWSRTDDETVMVLIDDHINSVHDEEGCLLPPQQGLLELMALRLMVARDAADEELEPDVIRLRKWLATLPIPDNVKDGSCIDDYLREMGADSDAPEE